MVCKNNCSGACNDTKATTDLPAESLVEMVDIPGLMSILTTIAATGIKNLSFKDVGLEKLARKISSLAAENAYLKKLAAVLSPVQAEMGISDICIHFGPANAYTLTLPITDDNRKELAQQLKTLAETLDPPVAEKLRVSDAQLSLFS